MKKRKILITGGSGFLANTLIKRLLLDNKNEIRLFARNEGQLIKTKQQFPSVEIYTGNIDDSFNVKKACQGIQEVFHLAAFKHVGLAEDAPRECIKSNLIGTINLLEESLVNKSIKKIISISTDKAAQINGVYGASKFLMERVISEYEKLNTDAIYRVVRYGNVLYSTGSVLCKWKEAIQNNKQCIITDLDATRFYWTSEQAVDLIFDCIEKATNSSPYCPTMKSIKIKDLFEAMVLKYGNNYTVSPMVIGLQKGENLHEKILESGPYSNEVEYYSVQEILNLI